MYPCLNGSLNKSVSLHSNYCKCQSSEIWINEILLCTLPHNLLSEYIQREWKGSLTDRAIWVKDQICWTFSLKYTNLIFLTFFVIFDADNKNFGISYNFCIHAYSGLKMKEEYDRFACSNLPPTHFFPFWFWHFSLWNSSHEQYWDSDCLDLKEKTQDLPPLVSGTWKPLLNKCWNVHHAVICYAHRRNPKGILGRSRRLSLEIVRTAWGPRWGREPQATLLKWDMVSVYSCQCAGRLHVACYFHAKVSFSAFRSLIWQEKRERPLCWKNV